MKATKLDISRRSFLRGALVVSAASVLPALPAIAEDIPTLYGDGIHDDKDGLEALFNGRKVRVDGEVIQAYRNAPVHLRGGVYAVSGTIHVTEPLVDFHQTVTIENATIKFMEGKRADCIIYVHETRLPQRPYSTVLYKNYASA